MRRQLSFLPTPPPPRHDTDPVTELDLHRLHHDQRQAAALIRWSWRSETKRLEAHYRSALIRLLNAAGITQIAVQGANDHCDLIICGWPVELKFSTSTARRPHYYQFKMRSKQLAAATVLICVAIPPDAPIVPFIIPSAAIGHRRTVEISSHPLQYTGQWSPYRGAYHLLKKGEGER